MIRPARIQTRKTIPPTETTPFHVEPVDPDASEHQRHRFHRFGMTCHVRTIARLVNRAVASSIQRVAPSQPNTPGRIRTCDRRFRKPLLYPPELRAQLGPAQLGVAALHGWRSPPGRAAPGRIRTCDLRFRKPPLYPPELRARRSSRLRFSGMKRFAVNVFATRVR